MSYAGGGEAYGVVEGDPKLFYQRKKKGGRNYKDRIRSIRSRCKLLFNILY